jgi:hypothetical protein
MSQPTRKDMDKRDIRNAYGRYSGSDQVSDNEYKNRGRLRGGDKDHRGDRSDEVPGTYEGSKGSKDEGHRLRQGTGEQGIAGTPRRCNDDYPGDASADRKI